MLATQHFKPESDTFMTCPCCGKGGLSVALLIVLEHLREHFGKPVIINSGARCEKYNKEKGGAKRSEHLITKNEPLADAADIRINGISPTAIAVHLKSLPYANLLGIGKYKSWVHIDTRGYAARW